MNKLHEIYKGVGLRKAFFAGRLSGAKAIYLNIKEVSLKARIARILKQEVTNES